MFLSTLDFISPKITIYHKGKLSHKSIFSGILSIISIVIVVAFGISYLLEIIQRTDPNTFYFNSFIEDVDPIQINSSSLFHFIVPVKYLFGQLSYEQFDFTVINIVGVTNYYENFISKIKQMPIKQINRWVYGLCDKEDVEFEDLINYTIYEKSACIKKYCNKTTQQCYDKGDPNFVIPEIAHGTFNENNSLYNIIVKKCDNSTIKEILGEEAYCKSDDEINKFFDENIRVLYLYFLNNYINVLNYDNPINKFFYRITNILIKNQYMENNININPALVKSHDGLIFNKIKEHHSYSFDRNNISIRTSEGIYMAYCFYLQNMMIYYERAYKRIQDVISDIGGIYQAIIIFSICLNYFYNEYIILSDTSLLLNSSIEYEKKIHKSKLFQSHKTNKELKKSDKNKKNEIKEYSHISRQNLNVVNKSENEDKKEIKEKIKISENKKLFTTKDCVLTEQKTENKNEEKGNIYKEENKKENEKNNFYDYLCFKLSCKKEKLVFRKYEKFRTKILSEEHLIRNHLNIYNLLRVTRGHAGRSSYKFSDLINLI